MEKNDRSWLLELVEETFEHTMSEVERKMAGLTLEQQEELLEVSEDLGLHGDRRKVGPAAFWLRALYHNGYDPLSVSKSKFSHNRIFRLWCSLRDFEMGPDPVEDGTHYNEYEDDYRKSRHNTLWDTYEKACKRAKAKVQEKQEAPS